MESHTTTSIARMAASRELMGIFDDQEHKKKEYQGKNAAEVRFNLSGVALENIQGPIPELLNETPWYVSEWQEFYDAAARSSTIKPSFAPKGNRRIRPSPYSRKLVALDNNSSKRPAPTMAVAFDKVYGKSTTQDDFAAALLSLTNLGQEEENSTQEQSKIVQSPAREPILSSMFPVKGITGHVRARNRAHSPGRFVSGGQG